MPKTIHFEGNHERTNLHACQNGDAIRLEYDPEMPREVEPLMGWTSSGDMKSQIKLRFGSKEEAIHYAERNGLAYRVEEPAAAARKIQSYSDNFKSSRLGQWTH